MANTNPNDAANPCIETGGQHQIYTSEIGLTKREYFAAKALQGLSANESWTLNIVKDDWDDYIKRLTIGSVEIADALIEALNKQ